MTNKRDIPETLTTFAAMLAFVAGKTVRRELKWQEMRDMHADFNITGGVVFTDGTKLICAMDEGFTGSDVTGPDPVEVVYLAYRSTGRPA